MILRKIAAVAMGLIIFAGCKDQKSKGGFTVTGKIANNAAARYIYLEEIPMATMQRVVVDSVLLGDNGKFTLHDEAKEATVYNIRLDQNTYPVGSVINDAPSVELNISFSKENSQFPESYDVSGSPASGRLKDFMFDFNDQMQTVFTEARQLDTLQKQNAPDSIKIPLGTAMMSQARKIRDLLNASLAKADNPALLMFELGYYQSTLNGLPGLQLIPFSNEEVSTVVNDASTKYPDHSGIIAIKKSINGLVGEQAPDFTLPDVNGKEVSLNSFRGKYVLVDFWASWCEPCRRENPNVVAAYKKFSGRNFTILGVSIDKTEDKDKWLKAIKDDNLAWTQVIAGKDWQSPVADLYKFDAIPFNVLVDPTGKVIAKSLEGEKLDEMLTRVLK